MRRTITLLIALGLFLSGTAFAGEIYVPISVNSGDLDTIIYLDNRTDVQQDYKWWFVADGANGKKKRKKFANDELIGPGERQPLADLIPNGQTGMLGFDVPDGVVLDAVLLLDQTGGGGEALVDQNGDVEPGVDADELPAFSSHQVFLPGDTIRISGWTGIDEFYAVNMSESELANCTANVFNASGDNILSNSTLVVKKLGFRSWNEISNLNNIDSSGALVEVQCDQSFWAGGYATHQSSLSEDLGETFGYNVSLVTPAPEIAASGGGGAGGSGDCELGGWCKKVAGQFHKATKKGATAVKRISGQPPAGTYSRMLIQVEVVAGQWGVPASGTHNIFWAAQNGKNIDMFGYVNVRNQNNMQIRHGIGVSHGDKSNDQKGFAFQLGVRYRFVYLYDARNDQVLLEIFQGGSRVFTMEAAPPNIGNNIFWGPDDQITIDFGFTGLLSPNEPWQPNWAWSNLVMEVQ